MIVHLDILFQNLDITGNQKKMTIKALQLEIVALRRQPEGLNWVQEMSDPK